MPCHPSRHLSSSSTLTYERKLFNQNLNTHTHTHTNEMKEMAKRQVDKHQIYAKINFSHSHLVNAI